MKKYTGFLIIGAITVVMISLKMNHQTELSWIWIFFPVWFFAAVGLIAVFIRGIVKLLLEDNLDLEECIGCGNYFHYGQMSQDDAGEDYCPECWMHFEPLIKAEYEELVRNGEIEA